MNDDQEELLLSDEHREGQTAKEKDERCHAPNRTQNRLNDHETVGSSEQESLFINNHQHHAHHGHSHLTVDIFQDKPDSMFSFFIVFFATSIHSLLEGKTVVQT